VTPVPAPLSVNINGEPIGPHELRGLFTLAPEQVPNVEALRGSEVRSKLTVRPPTPAPPCTDSNPVTGAVVKSLIVEPNVVEKSVEVPEPDTAIACVAAAQVLAPLKLKQYVLPPRNVMPSAGPVVPMFRMPPSPVGIAVAKAPDTAKV